jgi:hypothetical protein
MTALAPSDPKSRATEAPSCQPAIATGHEETKSLPLRPYRVCQVTKEPWEAVGASLSPVAPGFAAGEPLRWEAEPLFPLDRCFVLLVH